MSKRGRKKKLKLNIKPETVKSVLAVFLILLGALSFWSLLAPSYKLTSVFYKQLTSLFGYGMYFVPLSLIYTGIIMLWPVSYRLLNLRIVIGLYFLFTLVSSISESLVTNKGGVLGLFISNLLTTNIGYVGNLIVLFLALFATLIFISDVPIPSIQAFFENLELKRKNKLDKEEDEVVYEEEESQDFEPEINYGSKYAILPSFSEPLEDEVIIPKVSSKKTSSQKVEKPALPFSDKVWDYPNLNLLDEPDNTPPDRGDIKARAKIIEETFSEFHFWTKI